MRVAVGEKTTLVRTLALPGSHQLCVMTTFFHLPREDVVFSHIFPRLEPQETWRLRLVCREFCSLCEEYFTAFCTSIAYEELVLEEAETLRDRACISRVLLASQKLKNISLRLSRRTASAVLSELLVTTMWNSHTNWKLVRVALVAVDYSCDTNTSHHSGWERLGEKCTSLKELHIEDVCPFDDRCLQSLTRQCASLVDLTLKSLPALRGPYLQKMADTSPHLTTLNLSGCYNIEVEQLQRMIRYCQNLRGLDFSSMFAAVNDETILTAKEFCPHLQWVCVTQCSRVTQRYLSPLVERGVTVIGGTNERSNHNFHKIWGQI